VGFLKQVRDTGVGLGIVLAFVLWYYVFLSELLTNFWYRVTMGSIILTTYAQCFAEEKARLRLPMFREIVWGAASGILLYILFFAGYNLFRPVLEMGALNVYVFSKEAPLLTPAFLLIITSFCEEYFWRGYIQEAMISKVGRWGIITASLLYASIHIPTLNLPLVFAALIAGLSWGVLYDYTKSIWVTTFSHIVWTELVFVFLPLA